MVMNGRDVVETVATSMSCHQHACMYKIDDSDVFFCCAVDTVPGTKISILWWGWALMPIECRTGAQFEIENLRF